MTFPVHSSSGRMVWPALGLCCLWLASVGVMAAPPRAGIFSAEDEEQLVLSDRSWLPEARLLVAVQTPQPPVQVPATTRSFDTIVHSAALQQRMSPALLHAVIAVESAYAPEAVSPRGAMGLMQLMPATAKELGVTRPFDPEQNIHAGARHLRRLLDEFKGDTTLALAAYNAGTAAVWRYGRSVPPFAETRAYVPRVLSRMALMGRPAALRDQQR